MNRRSFLVAGAGLTLSTLAVRADDPAPRTNIGLLQYSYGIRAKAEKERGLTDPVRFAEFARERGASAIQLSLGIKTEADCLTIRRACDRLSVRLEGIVSPPKEDQADQERFANELQTARQCGATVVRTVMLGGRRYEVFSEPAEFPAFAERSEKSLQRAEPIARDHKMTLAVENHKDFRVDEMVDLLKRFSSEWIGVCLDTGNNLALLDDPMKVVEALAPWTRSVHLKDIGVEESPDGFLMSEVPLGQGTFDLPRMVSVIRKANPQVRFQLEMITRDPLSIPCLTEKYWQTMKKVPATDLARTLAAVRKSRRDTPLPRITQLSVEKQVLIEDQHVQESFAFAAKQQLIPT